MNEHVINELERLVEQSVRPVRTEFASKKRMREDLYSHLSATFENEFDRCRDETEALNRTRERFGDPAEVGRELRDSGTLSQRFGYWFEQALGLQAHESFLHQLAKHLLVSLIVFVEISIIGLLFGLDRGDPALMLWIFGTLAMVGGLTGSVLQWLTDRMGRARINKSRALTWCYGFLSLLILPSMLAFTCLLLQLGPGIESFLPSNSTWTTALSVAPLGLLVAILLGPLSAERTLYLEKWAALEVPAE